MTCVPLFVLSLVGLAVASVLLERAGLWLAGMPWTWTAHLALASLALVLLVLARAVPAARPALVAATLGTLALTAASALVFPALLRTNALETTNGRPFCLVGPETSADPESRRRDPYVLAPAISRTRDLTVLTMLRPMTLVVELPDASPDPLPSTRRDEVFAEYTWSSLDRRFVKTHTVRLLKAEDQVLLDCLPMVDSFDPSASAGPAALVVWRVRLPDVKGLRAGDRRETVLYTIPTGLAPVHAGRFSHAEIGLSLPLIPGADPVSARILQLPDPVEWLHKRLVERVRDQDAPVDLAALPVNALGLTAYEVPDTSVANAVRGTYAVLGPEGRPITVIACTPGDCRHHVLPGPEASHVVTLHYPRDRLPDWQRLQAEAVARIATFIAQP